MTSVIKPVFHSRRLFNEQSVHLKPSTYRRRPCLRSRSRRLPPSVQLPHSALQAVEEDMQERADFVHELAEHVLGPESEPEVVAQFPRTSTVRCKLSRKKCRRGRTSFMSSQNMFWGQNQSQK
ncbi:hypothetical protein QR680_000441 [Steinernema hermaphroditum]|uniref:Uncharacterized protein n=1 Tax=Steinernema hermaphroditum TaxID=289476 RepID=A0AA39GVH0_9BILA|nr:hypothetical protein QR680_000441 [Steinernema hermaphroditum]